MEETSTSSNTNLKDDARVKEAEQNIDEIFKLNPDLIEVGSPEQYRYYIETIFPNSKVHDIVWHYSDAQFKDEGFKPTRPNFNTLNSIEGVYNFSTNKKFVERFGKHAYPVVLNISNPLEETSTGEYADDMDKPLSEALFITGKQTTNTPFAPKRDESKTEVDGFINHVTGEFYVEKHPVSGREVGMPAQKLISVFDPDQIHILGSKQDLEKFRNFVQQNTNGGR